MKRHDPNALLAAIIAYQQEHGYSPSILELMLSCGHVTKSTVEYSLRKLEAAGRIRRTPGIARSIVVMG